MIQRRMLKSDSKIMHVVCQIRWSNGSAQWPNLTCFLETFVSAKIGGRAGEFGGRIRVQQLSESRFWACFVPIF